MYQVVEVKRVTVFLSVALVATLVGSGLTIGWLARDNASLRAENAELLKAATKLTALNSRISTSSNRVIDHVAKLGLENMALVSHACGSRTARESADILRTLAAPEGEIPPPAVWLLPNPTEPDASGQKVAAKPE